MADSKITGLTNLTVLTDDDVFAVVDDAAGTATTKKVIASVISTLVAASSAIAGRLLSSAGAAPTIASATTIAPTAPISFVSGITGIETITVPSPISTRGGQLTIIPTGIFLTGVTGNIALATTSVVGKVLVFTYDPTTTKWYPSY